jgi:hypothetical protein
VDALKAEQLATSKWRVLAIPFGGPLAGGRDLDGEFFSPRTDVKASWFKERPVLFHHGQDEELGDAELGIEGELTKQDDGWWAQVWLNRSHRYWSQVDALLRAGKMYGSSGALGHLVRKSRDGEILVWPHIEQTLTPTPANPYARVTAGKALAGFDLAGIEMDASLRGVLSELDRLTGDLRPDLPAPGEPSGDLGAGGDDAARRRLADALQTLEALLRKV